MTRTRFIHAAIAVVLSAVMLPSGRADELADPFDSVLQTPPLAVPAPYSYDESAARPVTSSGPVAPQRALYRQPGAAQLPMAINPEANAPPPPMPIQQPGYVRLGAPMYPSPVPNIPIWAGSTMITSPALAPHEMLYPHTYRALYPPYYHRVKGGWMWTPFGIRSHEKWQLQGTMVEVKYRSQPPIWIKSMWCPPITNTHTGYRY